MDQNGSELREIAHRLVVEGKGILAADESTGTIGKRLASIDVPSTEETRRTYRELLFTTPGMESFISGVILYDETIRQKTRAEGAMPKVLADAGVIPGIKVDTGTIEMPFFPGEYITEGLDGLRERLKEYHGLGARFAKWRAVITIGPTRPTLTCIDANAHALARYAALCQEVGLVPIVEPEVLMDGDHDIDTCQAATDATLRRVFIQLRRHLVDLEGILLKPNMVLPGEGAEEQVDDETIARYTLDTFYRTVPAAVPGIVFLSGGQSPEAATRRLNEMNRMGPHPWALSFSYGRALQEPVLEAWRGHAKNEPDAQQAFHHRAQMNSLATRGEYTAEAEAG